MKTLALDLVSVIVRPLWDIASLGELASGVPLRPWITFHAIAVVDLGLHMWSHPSLRSSTRFRFSNVGSSSGD